MAFGNAKTPDKRKSYSNEKNLFFSEKIRVRRLELGLKQSELGKTDGTVISARDFRYALDHMFLYVDSVNRKAMYVPYSAVAKIVTSDKT